MKFPVDANGINLLHLLQGVYMTAWPLRDNSQEKRGLHAVSKRLSNRLYVTLRYVIAA